MQVLPISGHNKYIGEFEEMVVSYIIVVGEGLQERIFCIIEGSIKHVELAVMEMRDGGRYLFTGTVCDTRPRKNIAGDLYGCLINSWDNRVDSSMNNRNSMERMIADHVHG